MIPVMQTITGDRGNCLTAAIASLMERKIEDVDYFFEVSQRVTKIHRMELSNLAITSIISYIKTATVLFK